MPHSRRRLSRHHLAIAASGTVLGLMIVGGLWFLRPYPAGWGRGYTCALCRMGRSDAHLLGSTRTTYHENDFSRWYASYFAQPHTHIWEPFSNVATRNVFGETIGGGTGRHATIPIFHLLSESQYRKFLEHVKDIRPLEELFASIHADEARVDLDPAEEGKGLVIVDAISEWQAAGYPGTWNERWARWWDDWMSWMHSSKGRYNFRQWQALRSK